MVIGDRVGPYTVVGMLGAGGMGEVYRATDTKLNRDAALKILPESLTADPDRRARFTREAQVLASLSHPNIAGIYGFEDASGVPVLAMEFVEGEDLSTIIARGAIPLADALPLARQIAEALEAAHEQGIVHRDLKPANVKVRPDGTVKVLDFGLAKALDQGSGIGDQGSGGAANSPTITTPAMTMRGMILGTAAYMSPEQAKGKPVDKRADIWAFGAVLYEMLSGRRAFQGEGVSETLAAVIKDAPELTLLPTTTPLRIRALIERCLERDVKRRLRDIGEARITLTGSVEPAPPSREVQPVRRALMGWMAAGIAVLVAGALAVPAWRYVTAVTGTVPPAQFALSAPDGSDLQSMVSVLPDGRSVVFVSGSAGSQRLWRRRLDSMDTTELVAAQGGNYPFWSPDSTQLAYFAAGQLKVVDMATGSARVVCADARGDFGGSWNRDGTILFGGSAGLLRVPGAGGTPVPVAMNDGAAPTAVRLRPDFLPDGRHFLYSVRAASFAEGNTMDIYIGDLQSGGGTRLLTAESHAVATPGFVLFARAGTLFAQPFDADSLELSGTAQPLQRVGPRLQPFAVSQNGVLALRPGDTGRPPSDLVWIDRRGVEIGKLKKPPTGDYAHPALSPDGQQVAVNSLDPRSGRNGIWIIDTARDVAERFTVGDGWSADPVWSPDGRRLAFVTEHDGRLQIVSKALDGSGEDVLEDLGPGRASDVLRVTTTDWSPDGKLIVYSIDAGRTNQGLRVLSVADRTSSPLGMTSVRPYGARFSRDGRWIAYSARDSGTSEVYIAAFPGLDRRRQVSNDGAVHPRWGKNDREVFYTPLNSAGISVVPLTESGADLRPGVSRVVYDRDLRSLLDNRNHYTATADGDRLLVRQPIGGAALSTVRVLVNWPAMLQK